MVKLYIKGSYKKKDLGGKEIKVITTGIFEKKVVCQQCRLKSRVNGSSRCESCTKSYRKKHAKLQTA